MEDLKRLLSPAIVAIVLHGLLISFKLPKQETLEPILDGNLIKIEINATSPPPVVPEKKEEPKNTEIIPNAISQKKVVKKKVITQPAAIQEQYKKRNIKQEQKEKKVSLEERIIAADLQNKSRENQSIINNTETSPQKIRDKSILNETVAVAHTKNINTDLEGDLSTKKSSTSHIQKTAIPMYRQNKKPPYPAIAKLRGYEGVTLLSVLVSTEGMVSELKIKHSSGHLSLDNAALQTVKSWLFTQATEGGRHVAMWVDIPIKFELK